MCASRLCVRFDAVIDIFVLFRVFRVIMRSRGGGGWFGVSFHIMRGVTSFWGGVYRLSVVSVSVVFG